MPIPVPPLPVDERIERSIASDEPSIYLASVAADADDDDETDENEDEPVEDSPGHTFADVAYRVVELASVAPVAAIGLVVFCGLSVWLMLVGVAEVVKACLP